MLCVSQGKLLAHFDGKNGVRTATDNYCKNRVWAIVIGQRQTRSLRLHLLWWRKTFTVQSMSLFSMRMNPAAYFESTASSGWVPHTMNFRGEILMSTEVKATPTSSLKLVDVLVMEALEDMPFGRRIETRRPYCRQIGRASCREGV